MVPFQKNHLSKNAIASQAYPTLGFLTFGIDAPISSDMWDGICDVAQERGANALCFPGGWVRGTGYDVILGKEANILYRLARRETVDGLVIWGATILECLQPDEFGSFYAQYAPLPMVNIGQPLPGIPTLVADNAWGVRQLLLHLLNVHRYRHFAFIRGPEGNLDADERYCAYREILKEHDILFDPALVAHGDNQPLSGATAVQQWSDEQHASLDVIVASNDNMALGALEALQAKGIRVPEDVAIVGFDDIELAQMASVPLTTVRFSFYEFGRRAAAMLLDQVNGHPVLDQQTLPLDIVVRQSCGCLSLSVVQAAVDTSLALEGETLDTIPGILRNSIAVEISKILADSGTETPEDIATQVLEGFIAEIQGSSGAFLSVLTSILHTIVATGQPLSIWQDIISVLRHRLFSFLTDKTWRYAENLWGQARVLIGDAKDRTQALKQVQRNQQIRVSDDIGQLLITTFDLQQLAEVLAENLPRLEIPSAYLVLYESPQPYHYPQDAPPWSRLVMAYDERGCLDLGPEGQRFPTSRLIPQEVTPQGQFCGMILPLYFQQEQIGLALLECRPRDSAVYERLRTQISSALQGALLVRRVQERSAEIARQKYILETFMESVPDTIYFKDRDSRITHANRAHARVFGFSDPAEEIGKTDFDLFPEELARKRYQQEQNIIRTGQPLLEEEETDREGHWTLTTKMPLRDERGEIIGTFGISRDITAIKRVEQTLLRLKKAVETTEVGITIADPEGRIVYSNPAEAAMHGYTVEELLGQSVKIFASQTHRSHPPDMISKNTTWRRERFNQYRDGSEFPVRLLSNDIYNSEGQFIGRVTVCEDMTEQKRAEEALLKAHQAVQEKNRELAALNASKDTFFSIISHDLRSPFTTLLGFAQLLDHNFDQYPPEQHKHYIKRIRTSAERLYALLENLLTWARLQQGAMPYDPEIVDLADLAKDTVSLLLDNAKHKGILLDCQVPDQTMVFVDVDMIQTVLRNLVSNALKFTPEGGNVRLAACEDDAMRIQVSVSDTGVGIQAENLSKLFQLESHYTEIGTAGEQGTGLGLKLCKDLAARHGGDLWVESQLGQGTIFRFTLPRQGREC